MITHLDSDYHAAKLVKQGRKQLTYPIKDLAKWIGECYRVNVVNIYYDIQRFDDRPRLNVALEFEAELVKFKDLSGNFSPDVRTAIAAQWYTLVVEATRDTPFGFLRWFGKHTRYRIDNLIVVFSGFDRCAKSEANSAIPKEDIEELQHKLSSRGEPVWLIDRFFETVTFFLHSETQATHYRKAQHQQRLADVYYELLQPHDEFGYIDRETFTVQVDSKEKLDKVYNGSLMNYYR